MALIAPLAQAFQGLQAEAAQAGFNISIGSGCRSEQEQADLRIKNGCPDVWSSPASSCRVPTAIPGQSMHNKCAAIDIDYGPNRDAAVAWVHANAARFGLGFPVEGEDWHTELLEGGGVGGVAGQIGGMAAMQGRSPEEELAQRMASILHTIGMDDLPNADFGMDDDEMALGKDLQVQPSNEVWSRGGGVGNVAGGALPGGSGNDPHGYGAYARSLFKKYGWDDSDYSALVWLWNKESGDPSNQSSVTWNPNAQNPTSSAYGIPQFLNGTWAGTGFAKSSNPQTQIQAGLQYIASRYGNPREALAFHRSHNWY